MLDNAFDDLNAESSGNAQLKDDGAIATTPEIRDVPVATSENLNSKLRNKRKNKMRKTKRVAIRSPGEREREIERDR